jgi:hypothetical protein
LLFGTYFIPLSITQTVNYNIHKCFEIFDEGQVLFAPMWGTTTYLIDSDGTVNHTWSSSYLPGISVWWMGDGTILRSIKVAGGPIGGGAGGGVQKIQWDGTVVWDFRYNTDGRFSHHDVKSLPNGNIIMIAWETKTQTQAISAGRNPDYVSSSGFMPDHIIEVQPTGPSSGTIVWEWHVWDHLIQDYDYTKENYGVVADHPELIDANYASSQQVDWIHTNSIDYNEKFDQILISVRNFNEIWIIDHSTTTEEAAGHTGGNSGKGGDLLYRWGNPAAYRRGNLGDQKLFQQHDATWIEQGCPGEGNILIFNNGVGRGYSTVDEITPPVNNNGEYYLGPGNVYGPDILTWVYNPQPSFYASYLSGAQRLANGNTLINNGAAGKIFEVNPAGTKIWQYTSPYPHPSTNGMFKVVYVSPEMPPEPNVPDLDCLGSLSWTNIKTGATVNGSFEVKNIGSADSLLNWSIDITSIDWGTWTFNPESGVDLNPEDGQVTIQVSVVTPSEKKSKFEGYIRVENQNNPEDFELIPVYLKTSVNTHACQTIAHLFLLKIRQWHIFIKNMISIK